MSTWGLKMLHASLHKSKGSLCSDLQPATRSRSRSTSTHSHHTHAATAPARGKGRGCCGGPPTPDNNGKFVLALSPYKPPIPISADL